MSGFVYFVQCHDRIKIGFSHDPKSRFVKINTDTPYPCVLLGVVSAAEHSERDLHKRFDDLRVHGEWFIAAKSLLAFVGEVTGKAVSVPAPKRPAPPKLVKLTSAPPHPIVKDIDDFLTRTGMGETYFGKRCANDSALVRRLRAGITPGGKPVFIRPEVESAIRSFIEARAA